MHTNFANLNPNGVKTPQLLDRRGTPEPPNLGGQDLPLQFDRPDHDPYKMTYRPWPPGLPTWSKLPILTSISPVNAPSAAGRRCAAKLSRRVFLFAFQWR